MVETKDREDLTKWAREHSWNLMTQMKEYLMQPIIIERGEGCWLYDIEGKRYFDGNASMWTNVHGHNNAELNEALKEQLGKFAHTTYVCRSNEPAVRLSAKLAEISPEGLKRVFFTNNGSTAIEAAMKMSFQYWQMMGRTEKAGAISMKGGHHGLSFGAMSVGGNEAMHGRFKQWGFNCEHFETIEELEELLEKTGRKTAFLVMEPSVQCVAGTGMKLQEPGFLKDVSTLCKKHEVHLILDEVFVGFGRTGPMFACEEEGVTPDFLCLGKGISAGYMPLGATLTNETIYEAFLGDFAEGRTFVHGHTYGGNPLATAVAHRSIEMLEARITSGAHAEGIARFEIICRKYFTHNPYVKEIRQRGFMCAVELKPIGERLGYQVCQHALDKGLLIRAYGDTILLVPPLVVNEEEMEFLCKNTSETITETIEKNETNTKGIKRAV